MRLEIKINWEKQINKQTNNSNNENKSKQKNQKTKQNKKKTVTTEKAMPSQSHPIFLKDLSQVVNLFLSQKSIY